MKRGTPTTPNTAATCRHHSAPLFLQLQPPSLAPQRNRVMPDLSCHPRLDQKWAAKAVQQEQTRRTRISKHLQARASRRAHRPTALSMCTPCSRERSSCCRGHRLSQRITMPAFSALRPCLRIRGRRLPGPWPCVERRCHPWT